MIIRDIVESSVSLRLEFDRENRASGGGVGGGSGARSCVSLLENEEEVATDLRKLRPSFASPRLPTRFNSNSNSTEEDREEEGDVEDEDEEEQEQGDVEEALD